MTTQPEEQLEQASAPESFEVTINIPFGPCNYDTQCEISDWCTENIGPGNWQALGTGMAKNNSIFIFSFNEELDALAFRLMFSEYL